MDSLWDDSTVDFLVNNNTDGSLVDVEDNTSSAVVVLERHTLVLGRIDLDINIVSSLVVSEDDLSVRKTLGLVGLLEEGAGASTVTKAVWHFS